VLVPRDSAHAPYASACARKGSSKRLKPEGGAEGVSSSS
jgi:hypothetical protein